MRIEQLHVDDFGRLADRDLAPSPGLTLVRGLNEAGKSTLLGFVRAVLFGFDASYPAPAGGRRGGRIRVRMADGHAYAIERHGVKRGTGVLRVTDVADETDRTGELSRLLQNVDETLYGNVFAFGLAELADFGKLKGPDIVSRISGAGLGIGSVNPVEAERRLRAAADGLFLPSASKPVINDLLGQLEALDADLRRRNLPEEFDELSRRLRAAESMREALVAEVGRLEGDVARAGRHAASWEAWQDLLDAESRRDTLGTVERLPPDVAAELASVVGSRDGAERRVVEQQRTRDAAAEALGGIAVDEELLARRAELEALAADGIKDEARSEQLAALGGQAAADRATLDHALRRLGEGWDEDRVARFDDSVAVAAELGGRLRDLLGGARQRLDGARAQHEAAERAARGVETELARVEEQRAGLEEPDGAPPVDWLERQLRALDSAMATRDAALSEAARAHDAVESARATLPVAPGGRPWVAVAADVAELAQAIRDEASARTAASLFSSGLGPAGPGARRGAVPPAGAAVLAGVVAAAVLALVGQPVAGLLAAAAGVVLGLVVWRVGAAGAAGAGAAGADAASGNGAAAALAEAEHAAAEAASRRAVLAARVGLAGSASDAEVAALAATAAGGVRAASDLASLEAAAVRAADQARRAEEALAAVAVRVGLVGDVGAEGRDAFAVAVAEARSRVIRRAQAEARIADLTATLRARNDELARSAEALDQARQANESASREWLAWLERHDLAGVADRDAAQAQVAAATLAKGALAKAASTRAEMDRLRRDHEAYAGTASSLAAALGLREPDAGPADDVTLARLVVTMREALASAIGAQARRRSAAETLATADRALAAAQRELEAADAALARLLEAHRATDAESLRQAVARSAEAKALDDRIAAGERVLLAQSGPGDALASLRAELAAIESRAQIDEALAEAAAARDVARGELAELSEQIGGLKQSVEEQLRDASQSALRQDREDLLGRLDELARDWAAAYLAGHLLRTARAAYESEHRPAVIGIAERHFAEWTEGRYVRIVAPLGSMFERVERADGASVALDALSLGTAQQLYLAVRFGLLEHFAENAEPLPVIMDDVLVNFDPIRAARTATSIRELARTHQVLYFTCHEEVPLEPDLEVTLGRL